jgi:hypothetical protein
MSQAKLAKAHVRRNFILFVFCSQLYFALLLNESVSFHRKKPMTNIAILYIDIDIDVKIKFFSLPRQIECREINKR